jgi:DNA-binding beta-propeller fold protein YncE
MMMFARSLAMATVALLISFGQSGFAQRGYTVLVVQSLQEQVSAFPSDHPERLTSVKVAYKPHEIAVSADGRTAYVSNFGLNDANNLTGIPGTTISVIDVASMKVRKTLTLPTALKAPHGVALRPGHETQLFTNTEEGDAMVVFDCMSEAVLRQFAIPAGIHNFVFSQDGASIYAFAGAGFVVRIDAETGKVAGRYDAGSPVRGLTWVGTGNGVELEVSLMGAVVLLNPKDMSVRKRFALSDGKQTYYAAVTPDQQMLFVPSIEGGDVKVVRLSDGKIMKSIPVDSPLRVIIPPDGLCAYVSTVNPASHPTVIDLKTLQTRQIVGLNQTNGIGVAATAR